MIIICALLILSPAFVFSQNTTGKDTVTNYTDINGNKQGKWIKYYDNSRVKYSGFFIDNIPQGVFRHYHTNGKIKALQTFSKDGSSFTEFHWKDGAVAAKGYFNSKRQKHGQWIYYFESGEKQKIIDYRNGEKDGIETSFYRNGNKLIENHNKFNKKEGEYLFYFMNGNIRQRGFYLAGMKQGEFIHYRPDGTIEERGIYKNNNREGQWLIMNDKDIIDTVIFKNGVRTDKDSLENEFWKKTQWAKEHQENFKVPEDYLDNPFEFFRQ